MFIDAHRADGINHACEGALLYFRETKPEVLDDSRVDCDTARRRVVGILRNELHIHEWGFAGFVEMLTGVHRVVPIAGRGFSAGVLPHNRGIPMTQDHEPDSCYH